MPDNKYSQKSELCVRSTGGVKVQLYSFFNLDTIWEWAVNATLRSSYPRQRNPLPFVQEVGWAQGRVVRVCKILQPPPGFDPRAIQAVPVTNTNLSLRLYEVREALHNLDVKQVPPKLSVILPQTKCYLQLNSTQNSVNSATLKVRQLCPIPFDKEDPD